MFLKLNSKNDTINLVKIKDHIIIYCIYKLFKLVNRINVS